MYTSQLDYLERESLTDRIAAKLRHSIITGAIPPGTHLAEIELTQQLKVSRGALREALRVLQAEGLVESFPNRGMFVARIEEQDIEEIYGLRDLLETFAMHLVTERATQDQIAKLQDLVNEMFAAAKTGKHQKVVDLDLDFHQTLWQISGHQRLLQLLTSLLAQIRTFLAFNTHLYEDLVEGIADHQRIVDAIRSKRADRAEQQMRRHIAAATRVVLPRVRKMERPR
jgi:GntR family transcriptional regulator of gluconate operon